MDRRKCANSVYAALWTLYYSSPQPLPHRRNVASLSLFPWLMFRRNILVSPLQKRLIPHHARYARLKSSVSSSYFIGKKATALRKNSSRERIHCRTHFREDDPPNSTKLISSSQVST